MIQYFTRKYNDTIPEGIKVEDCGDYFYITNYGEDGKFDNDIFLYKKDILFIQTTVSDNSLVVRVKLRGYDSLYFYLPIDDPDNCKRFCKLLVGHGAKDEE